VYLAALHHLMNTQVRSHVLAFVCSAFMGDPVAWTTSNDKALENVDTLFARYTIQHVDPLAPYNGSTPPAMWRSVEALEAEFRMCDNGSMDARTAFGRGSPYSHGGGSGRGRGGGQSRKYNHCHNCKQLGHFVSECRVTCQNPKCPVPKPHQCSECGPRRPNPKASSAAPQNAPSGNAPASPAT
jgi:hypothetical protein